MIRLFQYYLLLLMLCASSLLFGQDQLTYTHQFTRLLQEEGLAFQKPEGWFKVFPWQDEFLKYNLVLRSEKTGMDMRFTFFPQAHRQNRYPDFGLTKTIARIASSEDLHLVYYKPLDLQELAKVYSADWGMLVSFTPHPDFSEKERGKILVIHQEDIGSIYVVFLYDGSSEQVTPYLSTLTFGREENNKSG